MGLLSLTHTAVLGLTVEQSCPSVTKAEKKSAFISCTVTNLNDSNYVHWYQQKDGEPFKRILYINKGGINIIRDRNHPEASEFTVKQEQLNVYILKVDRVKQSHSAVYYCACWDTSVHSDRNYSHPVQKLSHY
uniref:Immunoglobulin domain-containing protein n=1 Tax=Electrophorus electricus TaxID=8005 RepID=A0A4W4HNM3_ELEEL